MLSSLVLAAFLAGTFDAGLQLGTATPFGSLESNQRGGIAASLSLGYNIGRNHFELENDLTQLPGSQQPDYALTAWRTSLCYHYALHQKVNSMLRVGAGIDWYNLRRSFGSADETGSVLGSTIKLTYVHRFGHPQFIFQLYGSELLEFGRAGSDRTLVPATLLGLKLGAGYEF